MSADGPAGRPDPAFYETVIATSPLVLVLAAGDTGDVHYLSPNAATVLGWDESWVAAPEGPWWQVVHADEREAVAGDFAAFLADKHEPFAGLARVERGEGEPRWTAVRFRADPSGSPEVFGFLLDVHDRVLADQEAKRERDLLHAVLDHANVSIQVKDLDGRFLVANKRIEEDFGLPPGILVGRRLHDIWPPEEADVFAANDATVVDADGPIQVEEVAEHPDGPHTYVSTKFPLRDAKGRTFAVGGIATDITARIRVEDELRRSQAFLDSIIENIPDMVFVKDAAELRFVRFNRAGEELIGRTRDELIGRNDHDLFPPEQADSFVAADRDVLARGELVDIAEEAIDTVALGRRILHTKKIPVAGPDGEPAYLLGISEDITERRSADDALRAAKEEAERANRAKSEFLSRMSHELRTPLNSILGFAQLLELDELAPDQAESVAHILKGGRHLLALINEVLDIARIESGTIALSLEPVALDVMIEECLDLVRPQALARHIELVNLDGRHRHVQADRQRLRQVLLNLLSNAVKFNRDGGTITVGCDHGDDSVRVWVTDTGPGIAPDHVGRLFTPFDRLDADATGRAGHRVGPCPLAAPGRGDGGDDGGGDGGGPRRHLLVHAAGGPSRGGGRRPAGPGAGPGGRRRARAGRDPPLHRGQPLEPAPHRAGARAPSGGAPGVCAAGLARSRAGPPAPTRPDPARRPPPRPPGRRGAPATQGGPGHRSGPRRDRVRRRHPGPGAALRRPRRRRVPGQAPRHHRAARAARPLPPPRPPPALSGEPQGSRSRTASMVSASAGDLSSR